MTVSEVFPSWEGVNQATVYCDTFLSLDFNIEWLSGSLCFPFEDALVRSRVLV